MAIFLPDSYSLILEVPKTGSKWVRLAIERSGVRYRQIGPPEWRGHATLAVHGRGYRFIACFVRNPISWYRSYWAYRIEHGWNNRIALDRECASGDFATFIRGAVRKLPGVLTAVYETYSGPSDAPIHFIGKQENLEEDLVRALSLSGEDFDEEAVRTTPRVNETVFSPEYPDELRELVMLSEFEAMERYGYLANQQDPFGLRDLLRRFPEDAATLRALAIDTEESHIEPDRSKAENGRGVGLGTRIARILSNFAVYMQSVKENLDETERLYEAAAAADPAHPRTLGHYACFLESVRRDYDRAEFWYKKALEVRPIHAVNLGRYALFLESIRNNMKEARDLYEKAIAANPDYAENLGRFAAFLIRETKDLDRAGDLLKRAVHLAPENATIVCNYALFLWEVRGDHRVAELFFRQAVSIEFAGPEVLLNFSLFLDSCGCDDEAEAMYERAIGHPDASASAFGAYALFLETRREDLARARKYYMIALELDENHTVTSVNYENFLEQYGEQKHRKRQHDELS